MTTQASPAVPWPAMAPSRVLSSALRDALRLDRSAITAGQGLRVAAGVLTALTAGTLGGGYAVGAAAAAGSLSAGMASLDVEGRPRLGRVVATCVGMSVATFLGAATGTIAWVHVLAAAAWVSACGYLAAVEPLALPVGLNSIIAFLVFGRFATTPGEALRAAAFVGAGASIQLILAALLRRPPHARRERRLLGDAYRGLAAYARSIGDGGSSLGAATTIETARSAVLNSAVHGVTREAWESLVDEAWRIRLQLIAVAEARTRLEEGGAGADRVIAVDGVIDAAASSLAALGDALAGDGATERADAPLAHLDATVTLLVGGDDASKLSQGMAGTWDFVRAGADALAGQLRAVRSLVTAAASAQGWRDPRAGIVRLRLRGVEGASALGERLLANVSLDSAPLRHAIRLTAVVLAATLIAHVLGLDRGYWIPVTAALVLRPDYAATMSRGISRGVGTVLGVGVASLLAVTVHPEGVALGIVVGVFTWFAASTLTASYFLFSVAITGTVVFLLATIDPSPVSDAEQRLLSTVIGAALALVAYALWPTWGLEHARRTLAELAAAERRYVVRVLEAAADPNGPARSDLAARDRILRRARANAEVAVAQSLADPSSRRINESLADGVLAALRRVSLAAHAIRVRVTADEPWPPTPELVPLTAELDSGLEKLSDAIASGRLSPPRTGALRALHRRLADEIGGRDEERAWLLGETDEIVDAVGTLVHLLGSDTAPERTPNATVRV